MTERLFKNNNSILGIKVDKVKSRDKKSVQSIESLRDSRLSPRNPAFDEFHQDYIHAREHGRGSPSLGFTSNPFIGSKNLKLQQERNLDQRSMSQELEFGYNTAPAIYNTSLGSDEVENQTHSRSKRVPLDVT